MSDVAVAEDNVSRETIQKRPRRDKEKARIYMCSFMNSYRADLKIAKPLGLTVGQWRKQQRENAT